MDIVVYVLDSLRPDYTTPYEASMETTENLDDISESGVTYLNAFAQSSWTRPSGASILSSTYPRTHGVETTGDKYPGNLPTIAEELSAAGFTTVGLSTMGNISTHTGFDSGFDEFHELYSPDDNTVGDRGSDTLMTQSEEVNWQDHFGEGRVQVATGEDINNAVRTVFDEHPDDDLFLFVWSIDTHDPYFHRDAELATFSDYDGPPLWWEDVDEMDTESDRSLLRDLYKDMVYYADQQIGNLTEMMRHRGRYEESLFVVCGDHGEAFGENGRNSHGRVPREVQVRVPLVMKTPSSEYTGVDRQIAELVDIYPTILEVAGVTPTSDFVQGTSLLADEDRSGLAHSELLNPPSRANSVRYVSVRNQTDELLVAEFPDLDATWNLKTQATNLLAVKDYLWFKLVTRSDDHDDTRLYEAYEEYVQICRTLAAEIKDADVRNVDEDVNSQLKAMGYID